MVLVVVVVGGNVATIAVGLGAIVAMGRDGLGSRKG